MTDPTYHGLMVLMVGITDRFHKLGKTIGGLRRGYLFGLVFPSSTARVAAVRQTAAIRI
jgi:hypothetical protein